LRIGLKIKNVPGMLGKITSLIGKLEDETSTINNINPSSFRSEINDALSGADLYMGLFGPETIKAKAQV